MTYICTRVLFVPQSFESINLFSELQNAYDVANLCTYNQSHNYHHIRNSPLSLRSQFLTLFVRIPRATAKCTLVYVLRKVV